MISSVSIKISRRQAGMRFGKGSLAPTTLLVGGPAFLTLMRPGKAQSPALQARIEALERQVQGLQAVIQELLKRPDATMDAPGERVASSVLPQVPPPPPKPAAPLVAQAQPPAPPAPPTVPRTSSGRSQCSSNGSWTIRSRCRGRGVGARALSDVDATTCFAAALWPSRAATQPQVYASRERRTADVYR
jgi:hypothetical protein